MKSRTAVLAASLATVSFAALPVAGAFAATSHHAGHERSAIERIHRDHSQDPASRDSTADLRDR